MKIQAAELLSLITSDNFIYRHLDENRVAQREVVVDGQRFLVQVISLSEPIIDE